jgi:hypothetical protein
MGPDPNKSLQGLALALGQLTLTWNDLHESLALVFCSVMGGGYVGHFLAILHAIKVDRAQRDILLAAVNSRVSPIFERQTEPRRSKIVEDI